MNMAILSDGEFRFSCCGQSCGYNPAIALVACMEKYTSVDWLDVGTPNKGPGNPKEECGVHFEGDISGCMVFSASAALFSDDWGVSGSRPLGFPGGIRDLVEDFLQVMKKQICEPACRKWTHQLVASTPEMWPDEEPRFSRAIVTNTVAIEIRYWENCPRLAHVA